MGDPSATKMSKHLRAFHRAELFVSRKSVLAVPPEAEMNVTARTGAVGGELGHKRHAHSHRFGRLFQTLFEDYVTVGHLQYFRVAHIQFVLAQSPFAFRVFNW